MCREHNKTLAKKAEEEKVVAKRAKRAKESKKKKEKQKQKAEEAKKAAAEAVSPGREAETSTSEEDSPRKALQGRLDRVDPGAARRALSFMEEIQRDPNFGECVTAYMVGNSNSNQPLMKGEVFATRTSKAGSQEDLIADTGFTIPIIGAELCRKKKIPISPMLGLKVVDAGGKLLPIVGYATFYVEIPQVGQRRRRAKAVVLDGDSKAILISLHYFKKWDIVTHNFLLQSISFYLKIKKSKTIPEILLFNTLCQTFKGYS